MWFIFNISNLNEQEGYIHQGNHTPTRLKAEPFSLYFTICNKKRGGGAW